MIASPFAKTNLHVWAFEEFDSIDRSALERAKLLKELGIARAGYICRNAERGSEFEDYVRAYQSQGIELVAVWTPVHTVMPLNEPQISQFLKVVDDYQLRVQWWLTLEEDFDSRPEASRIDHAVNQLRPLVDAANSRGCRLVTYGHGSIRWFTQAENQIAIVEQLKTALPAAQLGIVYNFHQSHAQMDRLKQVFPQLAPHLVALNLNGMQSTGPAIELLGKGDREREMIEIVSRSGWNGPVGILGHNRRADMKSTLQANLDGLRLILSEIGDDAAASTY